MEKYKRILTINNVSMKRTADHPFGFVALFDKSVPYIQGVDQKVFWRLNIDDINFERKRSPHQYNIRLGPNEFFVPKVSFRGGFLTKKDGNLEFEDDTEILVLSEELCKVLIKVKKEEVNR